MSDRTGTTSPIGRILVTGGAGFIGCAVSQLLAPVASQYVVADILHRQVHPNGSPPPQLSPDADLVVGDIAEEAFWDRLLDRVQPDIVVHLAAETGTGQSLSEASRHAMANVVGTTQMMDALRRHDVLPRRIVLASSRAVYGEGNWVRSDGTVFRPGQRTHAQLAASQWNFPDAEPLPSDAASTVPGPTSIYGATKLAQEHLLEAWCGAHDVDLSTLRFQNVYGPGQSMTNAYTGIVVLFAQKARRGEPIPLFEDGDMSRDFVYIDDVARSVANVATSTHAVRQCIDIGSGVRTTLRQLAAELVAIYGSPGPTITGAFRDGDVRHAWCSIESARSTLEWSPRESLSTGLRKLASWIEA